VEKIENMDHLTELEEFWANNNKISVFHDVLHLKSLQGLKTIYLEANPVAKDPQYRTKLKLNLPQLEQIDATLVKKV
jgi:protein phosphatase 1 regulatory subunit 7